MKIVYCLTLISLSIILTYYTIKYHQDSIFEGNIKIVNKSCKLIKNDKCYGIRKCFEILKNSWNVTNNDLIILEVKKCGYRPNNYNFNDIILTPFNQQKCKGFGELFHCNNYRLCHKKICDYEEKTFAIQVIDYF